MVGAAGGCTAQQVIVIWVPADAWWPFVREEDRLAPQELQERPLIGGCNGILPRDLWSTQDLSDLLELPRRHEQREGSPAPRVDELSLRPTGTQEAADELVRIQ